MRDPSLSALTLCFNPRTPAGCDEQLKAEAEALVEFQSTHPCGVRLWSRSHLDAGSRVSIHAPLRGATNSTLPNNHSRRFQSTHPCGVRQLGRRWRHEHNRVSIHAPLRGATDGFFGQRRQDRFQSTHPCGVRHHVGQRVDAERQVSIHAPLRGATKKSAEVCANNQRFNPRTPAGCDRISL